MPHGRTLTELGPPQDAASRVRAAEPGGTTGGHRRARKGTPKVAHVEPLLPVPDPVAPPGSVHTAYSPLAPGPCPHSCPESHPSLFMKRTQPRRGSFLERWTVGGGHGTTRFALNGQISTNET